MKTETKWTKGPWRAYKTADGLWRVRDSKNHCAAVTLTEPMARLIAQAPAMYEALAAMEALAQKIAGPYSFSGVDAETLTTAHQVLAAADGKES